MSTKQIGKMFISKSNRILLLTFALVLLLSCGSVDESSADSVDNATDYSSITYPFRKYSYPLTLPFENKVGARLAEAGTGFFIIYKGKYFLISAWHVFSAKDPTTLQWMYQPGVVAKKVRVDIFDKEYSMGQSYPLITDKNLFIEPRVDTSMYDIAALEVPPQAVISNHYSAIEITDSLLNMPANKTGKIFYCGFPEFGSSKRDLKVFDGNLIQDALNVSKLILSDIYTGPGCSGSPVFMLKENSSIPIGLIGGHDKLLNKTYIIPFNSGLKSLPL